MILVAGIRVLVSVILVAGIRVLVSVILVAGIRVLVSVILVSGIRVLVSVICLVAVSLHRAYAVLKPPRHLATSTRVLFLFGLEGSPWL